MACDSWDAYANRYVKVSDMMKELEEKCGVESAWKEMENNLIEADRKTDIFRRPGSKNTSGCRIRRTGCIDSEKVAGQQGGVSMDKKDLIPGKTYLRKHKATMHSRYGNKEVEAEGYSNVCR